MTGYESKKAAARDRMIDDDDTQVYQQAQPAQEPIGYAVPTFDFDNSVIKKVNYARTVPLYTTPPQRPWVGLTLNEIALIHANYPNPQGFALALQDKLKQKNT